MVTSEGSSSQVPAAPCGALASTMPVSVSSPCVEVSTKPPLPPPAPPRAEAEPAKVLDFSPHSVTSPPSPFFSASALIVVAASTATVFAVVTPALAPRSPPPMAIVPPPVAPLASMTAAFSVTLRPPRAMDPPRLVLDVALTAPETLTPLSPPSSTITPPWRCAEEADTEPEILTILRAACAAEEALISIRPPGA